MLVAPNQTQQIINKYSPAKPQHPYVQRFLNHEGVGEIPKHLIKISCFRSVVLKVWSRVPGGPFEGPNYFHTTTKMLFAFFILLLSQVSSGVFQRLRDTQL